MIGAALRFVVLPAAVGIAACSAHDTRDANSCAGCPELVRIEPGEMRRSSDPNPWVRGDAEFGEGHVVAIAYPFEISRYEVANAQWRACLEAGGCSHRPESFDEASPRLPVVDINWHDAKEYVGWLSEVSGDTYRLPTEAEWEYAARGGADTKFIKGDDPATVCDYANHRAADSEADSRNPACADGFPDELAPVGSLDANGFGLHDMLGNVWEWVEDCWHDADWPEKDEYSAAYPPAGPRNGAAFIGTEAQCESRVMRGGSWRNGSLNGFSPHFRNFDHADQRYPNLGFRVVRDIEDK